MNKRGRMSPAARETRERREREDAAPRLQEELPELSHLSISIVEKSPEHTIKEIKHIKHVVVAHAPALFDLPCCDDGCTDGGYDITYEVMRALRHHETTIEGVCRCHGQLGSTSCDRELHYTATADYAETAAA